MPKRTRGPAKAEPTEPYCLDEDLKLRLRHEGFRIWPGSLIWGHGRGYMGFPIKDYGIWGSILRFPYLGRLPFDRDRGFWVQEASSREIWCTSATATGNCRWGDTSGNLSGCVSFLLETTGYHALQRKQTSTPALFSEIRTSMTLINPQED